MEAKTTIPPWQRPRIPWLRWLTIGSAAGYLLALLCVTALLWMASDRWWPATVLLFAPRWAYALPVILLLPLTLVCHRKSLFTLAVCVIVLVFPIIGFEFATGAADNSPSLRVLSCNIHRRHLDAVAFRAMLDEVRPDVVALQDWSSQHEVDLFGTGDWYTRRDGELFLASRFPIAAATPIVLGDPTLPAFKVRFGAAMHYRLLTPDGDVSLVNLHLASPHEALGAMRKRAPNFAEQLQYNTRRRSGEAAAIREYVAKLEVPTILAGDFNTPRESAIYRENFSGFANAFSARGTGFGMTHVSTASSVRIDHVLLTDGWRTQQCWLERPAGSPHRPIVVDVARAGASNALAVSSAAP